MKVIIFSLLLCFAFGQSDAQTYGEWFLQKKTQKKYLIKQVGLLQLYLGYLKKGYDIASKGLTAIDDIKHGDFNLHRDFFGSLQNVNPVLGTSIKVTDCLAFQIFIVQNMRKVNDYCRKNQQFSVEEIRYVARVYRNLLVLTDASISELLVIARSGQSQMKDDERLQRIDKVYDDMLDQHAFVKSFDQDVRQIAAERERQKRAIQWTSKQYEII